MQKNNHNYKKKTNNTKARPVNSNGKNSRCRVSSKCGACQYIDKEYQEQLEIKRKYLNKLLGEFGNVEEVLGMEDPYYYRNKVTATFQKKKNGEIISGMYEEGTHNVIAMDECFLENKKAQSIIKTIGNLLKSFKITVHNEDSGYGLLKHVMVRTAHSTGQIMVILVTASPVFPSKKNFCKALTDFHPEITTIVQNINDKHTTMVLGERNNVLFGHGYIEDVLCGKTFRLSPNSFYQVNSVQTEVLYKTAMEYAGLTGSETALDAYCGTGTIGIVASDFAKRVIGVELNSDAVRDARYNAKTNGKKNIEFYNNDAGKFMVDMASQNEKCDVVFMDPPRSGSSVEFINSVKALAPKKVVYISCGPESLARDLKNFVKGNQYKVEKIVGVDLFPWSEHCEVVACMGTGLL